MLEVLKQNNLTYILAAVVRYFGGVKLGAGGLIRAYSEGVSIALDKAQVIQNIDQAIIDYIKKNFNLLIGERVAEELKIKIGTAIPLKEEMSTTVRGRDQVEGTLTAMEITSEHIRSAMKESQLRDTKSWPALRVKWPVDLA